MPHFLQTYGTWYLQRQLFGYLPDNLPDPDLHSALHHFFEERWAEGDYWRALIHTTWPTEFTPNGDDDSCGVRGPVTTAATYGVVNDLDPQVGLIINQFHDQSNSPTGHGSPQYSPQSPPASPTSNGAEAFPGYSPIYSPSSPTYTPHADHQMTEDDVSRIGEAIHTYRMQTDTASPTPKVIEITPEADEQEDDEGFEPDYEDY